MVIGNIVKSINKDKESRLAWLFLFHLYFLYSGIISLPNVIFAYKLIFIGVSGILCIVVFRSWSNEKIKNVEKETIKK